MIQNRIFLTLWLCLSLWGADWPSVVRADEQKKVVCFGDSITKRGYPKVLGQLIGAEAINAGIAGNTSREGLRRIKKDVLSHQPSVVVVFFGTNDLRVDAPHKHVLPDEYRSNLLTIIRTCRKQNAQVVLCTLPPIEFEAYWTRHQRALYEAQGGLDQLMIRYRDAAKKIAKDTNVPLVDLNQLLSKQPQWLSKDGVHPTPQGSAIIAGHIAKIVSPLLKKEEKRTTAEDNTNSDLQSLGK